MKPSKFSRSYHICFEQDDTIFYLALNNKKVSYGIPFNHIERIANRHYTNHTVDIMIPFTTTKQDALRISSFSLKDDMLSIIRKKFKQDLPRGSRPDIFTQRLRG